MEKQEIKKFIDPYLNIDDKNILSATFYAFQTKKLKDNSNNHLTLSYEFHDTRVPKKQVVAAVKTILKFFNTKYIEKKESTFCKYNVANPKSVIDYVKLQKLNFQESSILNGLNKEIDSDSYKVESFLNEMNTVQQAVSQKDYRGWKHSVLTLTTNNQKSITLINKARPVFKANGNLFTLDYDDDFGNMQPIDKHLIRLPFWPHIIIVDGFCFMVEPNVESIFGFEQFNKIERDRALTSLTKSLTFADNSFDEIDKYANKGKHYNMFANFDGKYINRIKDKDRNTLNLLKAVANIDLNDSEEVIIKNELDAHKFLAFICGFVKQDVLTLEYEIANKTIAMPK